MITLIVGYKHYTTLCEEHYNSLISPYSHLMLKMCESLVSSLNTTVIYSVLKAKPRGITKTIISSRGIHTSIFDA